jgi:hypothetical protein
MSDSQELLATDQRRLLEFFAVGLLDVSEPGVDRKELLYNASVLAHYALVSTQSCGEWPAPSSLSEVFDHFVADTTLMGDKDMMEVAGAQCLLLTGFFEDQMRGRHNIRWYSELGTSFYLRAAKHETSTAKSRLLSTMGKRFELWRQRHVQLSRELRDQRFLLNLPKATGGPPKLSLD